MKLKQKIKQIVNLSQAISAQEPQASTFMSGKRQLLWLRLKNASMT